MTDKYIGKSVLKSKSKRCIKKVPKVTKKDAFKVGIEPRMVNILQLKELGVQNTTAVLSYCEVMMQYHDWDINT